MGNISEQNWRQLIHYEFLLSVFTHPLPEILTKYNIKETASKGNFWGPFYKSKGEIFGGSQIIIKSLHENHIYDPNLNNLFSNE